MRKSTIAIGIAAALSTQAFVTTTNADAAVKGKLQKASGPSNSQPNFKYPNRSGPSGSTVLYDQSGTVFNGAPSQNFSSTYDAYDNASADDFVVTDAAGWDVSAFNLQITIGDPATATYDVNVYPNAGTLPGASTTCSYSALSGVVVGGTSLSVALPSVCHLDQGTYWVSVIANLDFAVGGQMFWSDVDPSIPALNSPGVFQNPGDGFGTGCTSWAPLATCGGSSPVGGGSNNFLFQVVGAVGGGGGDCGAGDLCLVTTVGTDTTPGACASTDTIDVSVGDQVNFCYVITNNTGIELDYHTLSDNVNGTIFSLLNQPVPDGGTFQFNRIATAGSSQTITSTWTGQDVPPGYAAEVTTGTGGDCSDRIFADGFDGTPVPCPGGSNFVDITGTGTPLNLGDDSSADVTMPFSFNFYGTTSNQLTVSNNGGALFNTPGSGLPFTNVSLPAASLSGPSMLPMWDDFDSEQGNIFTDTRGTTPDRQFIVEWFDRVHFSGPSNTDGATFELILNEDGTLQFEYLDVAYSGFANASGDPDDCTGGVCATIGLQNDDTLFNQFSAFENSVTNNSGILWTPTDPNVFTGTDTVTLNVGAPDIDVQPPALDGTVAAGGSSSIPFAINNLGDRDLVWTADEAGPSNRHFAPPGSRFAMPMGDPTKSTTARPQLAFPHPRKPGQGPGHGNSLILGGGVTAFAADVYLDQFYTLDVTANTGTNLISSAGGTAFGFKFLDGDLSAAFGIDKFGSQANTFASVSATDGTITPIGTSNPSADPGGFTGFAQDPVTGTLYASGVSCGSSSHLYTIDRNTGASTLVGELTGMPCAIFIAVSPDGLMYSVDIVNDTFHAVDKTSGATSLIGSIGFNANYGQDGDFDQSTGDLYYAAFNSDAFAAEIRTIDTSTGNTSLVYSLGFTQIVGLATETVGGACAQPIDLPWLSLNPTGGTTAAGGSTPVTASIDGTGTSDGDTLVGTVCVNSNDPDEHRVEVPVTVEVGGGGGGNVIDSGIVNHAVNADFTGLYINWLTGCTITSGGGACPEGTDFNPWGSGGLLNFFFPSAHSGNCVVSGTSCAILASGATVSSGSTFSSTGDALLFRAGNTTGFIGFSFINADTSVVNYGYAKFNTTGATGFPATLVEYWYDNSGAAITIP
ncbi:MAG: hypothetical protein ACREPX_15880 [Rhodanobacteraceae bacterium]